MSNAPQKLCFLYDGSDEADKALEIVKKKFNRDFYVGLPDVYYYSDVDTNTLNHHPDYTLVPPSEFIRLMKGEEWEVGDECCYELFNTVRKGRIVAIHNNRAWFIQEDNNENIIIDLSILRPIRKSLREELIDWANKERENLLDGIPELLSIIDRHEKERGVEG